MNEFNVLLAAATNGTPSGSLFDALFARYIAPQESWRELESPLPITILAAGEDLIDYRIFGNTVGGESVGERTENLFDKNSALLNSTIDSITGGVISSTIGRFASDYIKVNKDDEFTIVNGNSSDYVWLYNINKEYTTIYYSNCHTFIAKQDGYIRISNNADIDKVMLIKGSTAHTSYIPYGYKLPMVATNGTATTTTPIYIGSNPLAEDEYVDFGGQKIYRMEGGTLTPTDPPTPIPALSTIRGETIIDYNPSETPAVEPEKMYIKYKPQ